MQFMIVFSGASSSSASLVGTTSNTPLSITSGRTSGAYETTMTSGSTNSNSVYPTATSSSESR